MAMKYKPTKQKKEKAVKEPKAPKAEKALKFGSATKVKTKAPKAPKEPKVKAPKAEKVVTFKPGKVENAANLEKTTVLKKPLNMKIVGIVAAVLVVVAVLAITVVLPAIEEHGQQIKSIGIASTPDKSVYIVGEDPNYDGLRILVTRNNGETFTVRANNCEITGFDSSKAQDVQPITVTYEGFTTSFAIRVDAPYKVPSPLHRIEMNPVPKKESYSMEELLKQGLDLAGGRIKIIYQDGSVDYCTLTDGHIPDGVTGAQAGKTCEIIVVYTENSITRTTSFTITVTE